MNLNQLLAELSQKGIKLWVEGDQLRIRAPKGALKRPLRNKIIECKPDLLAFLATNEGAKGRKELTEIAPSPPRPIAPSQTYALSHNQRALWFLYKLAPQSVAYNTGFALGIRSVVDVAALRGAFELILERHGALRTTFPLEEGEPVQMVHPQQPLCFEQVDARGWSDDELKKGVQGAYERPFVLEEGPLMRVNLFARGPKDYVLLLSIHHIVFDGWSLAVLLNELGEYYPLLAARKGAGALALPSLRAHYRDFAAWQDGILGSAEGERLWAYWGKQLGGALPVLNLPTDRPRPPVQTTHGASYYFKLPDELALRLKEVAHEHGATRFMMLLAAFQVILHRYTGQSEILVGAPSTGRSKAEFARLIGYFTNRLILRAEFSDNPTFSAFLSQVRQTVLDAMAHQDYPFPLLVERLQPQRDPSRTPLFQAAFALHNTQLVGQLGAFLAGQGKQRLEWGGLEVESFALSTEQGQFDLTLQIVQGQTALSGIFKYNTDLFDEATIGRMTEHFQTLLASIVANPLARVADLGLLTPQERHQLLIGWNQSRQDFPLAQPFHRLFEAQVHRTPDAVAAYFEGQQVTYKALNRRANRLAHLLVAQGIEPERLVPLLARRSIDFLTAMLAIFKAGGAYLPLDPFHPPNRIAQVLRQSDSSLVLVGQEFAAGLAEAQERLPLEKQVPFLVLEEALATEYSEQNLPLRSTADDLAYVIFTSGSTGLPKGAMVEQKGMVNHLYAKILDLALTGEDSIAQNAPQSFDISVWQFLAGLLVGARVHIFNDEVSRDPMRLLSEVGQHQITIFELVPALMRMMLAGKIRPDLSKLRWLIPTGEALSPVLARQWLADYPTIPMLNAYGPTECSDDVTHYPIYEPPAPYIVNMPIGRPVANMRMYLLDKQLQPVPIGVVGELYVGGIGVGRGYLNDPERTAKAFIADHFSADARARLYKTGDLGRYLPDGNIEFLGRVDYQVKVRGFRIELGEIESVLAQAPSVQEVVVVAREDSTGEKQLVAYIVPSAAASLPLAAALIPQWRTFLQEKLPNYMVPAAFVLLEALPLTPNGKVNRRALPAPGAEHYVQEVYVAPESPLEVWLVERWREVLRLKKIGVTDNFFEIGGDSIKVAILVNKLQEQLGEVLHIVALFDAPTVRELASYLKQNYGQALHDKGLLGEERRGGVGESESALVTAEDVAQLRHLMPSLGAQAALSLNNRPAIFILSPPRSGSTLLRVLLGGHPQLFAPPELELLSFNTLAERKAAFRGRNSFWLEGLTRAIMQLKGGSAQEAQALMSELEGQGLTSQQMYHLLQEWLGSRTLVDKTPSYALDLQTLKRAEADFEQPLYIYLQRHPLACIHSFEKVRLDQVFFRHEHPFSRQALAELLWLVSHQNIQTFLADVPPERQYHLQFEQLVKEPAANMQALSQFLGIPFHPEMLHPYQDRKERMTDGLHEESRMLGDVKFHTYQGIEAAVADKWRDEERDLSISDLTRQVASRLGYQTPASASLRQVDLQAEAVLEASIQPTTPYISIKRPAQTILLTGATGFLGAYLLHELLAQGTTKIYCLVRAVTVEQGKERLKSTLEGYHLWHEADSERMIPLLGDLSQPRLGLSRSDFDRLAKEVDIIYHNGAYINFIYPYSMLKAPNVLGTQEILRLACLEKTKPLHFISTLAVFRSAHSEMRIALEDDPMRDSSGLEGGYAQSKWVAEKLVMQARERGLPTAIYRPGRITGESQSGATNTADLFSRMIKGCLQLGSVPALDMRVDMTPVDYVSRAIVHLSQQESSLNHAFHLANSRSLSWDALVNMIGSFGYQLEMIPYPRWRQRLLATTHDGEQEANALHPFLLFFTEEEPYQSSVQISEENTRQGLAQSNITCPPVDKALLERYFAYFKESGFVG